ncbi:MAG TPA: hypothetical protein VL051_15005 [Burkholderiaceae bacterium]|nr:hypothetical protein [Burkholderiaceae bacterium]
MAPQPEQQARGNIDRLLEAAGWHVCDAAAATARVCICTLQRMYSMLKGRDLLPELRANGGGRVLPRSTNPMTSFHC